MLMHCLINSNPSTRTSFCQLHKERNITPIVPFITDKNIFIIQCEHVICGHTSHMYSYWGLRWGLLSARLSSPAALFDEPKIFVLKGLFLKN